MAECTSVLRDVLIVLLCILTAVMLLCLIRAVRGPRYTDRLAALNLVCTVVVLMVCILSYVLGASYLVDVAILYGLLNLPHLGAPPPGEKKGEEVVTLRTGIGVLLLALGVLVVVIAAVGLFRFRRTLDLLQASALADTLGLFLITAGLLVLCGFTVHSAKLILAAVILWTVNPVAAHLIARMEVLTDQLPGEGEQEL